MNLSLPEKSQEDDVEKILSHWWLSNEEEKDYISKTAVVPKKRIKLQQDKVNLKNFN